MKTIQFKTGRVYDTPQVLSITIESESPDDFFNTITARFTDDSRHISGRVEIIVFSSNEIGPSVLKSYDLGQYESLIYSPSV